MDQRGQKSPSGPGHEGALCGLHCAVDVGSSGVWDVGENFSVGGVDNVEGFTVFVRNSLVVNKQAVAAVGKVIRMGIAGIFHGTTSWGF